LMSVAAVVIERSSGKRRIIPLENPSGLGIIAMPTIYVDGFALRVIPGDHDPPHVHVRKGGIAVIIFANEGVWVRDSIGMTRSELRGALRAVASVYYELQRLWEESHDG
jgi:gentisate 1,2-dioxygenase